MLGPGEWLCIVVSRQESAHLRMHLLTSLGPARVGYTHTHTRNLFPTRMITISTSAPTARAVSNRSAYCRFGTVRHSKIRFVICI